MSHCAFAPDAEHDQHLLDHAIRQLFHDRPDLIAPEQVAIRLILQGNLESGRISRRFNGHPPCRIEDFVAAYAATVADYYPQENPRLLSLHAGSPDEWNKLTDWLIRCAYVKLHRISERLSDLRADDFAQETNMWLLEGMSRVKQSVQTVPFSPAVGQAIGYRYEVVFSDWFAKVQSNHLVDPIRRLCRYPNLHMGAEIDLFSDEDYTENVLEHMTLTQAITKLTHRQQQVVAQLYEGLDVADISRQLDCTERAVYNRKYAAFNHLRRQLRQEQRF
jgi:RNA polymerase sigma factor (sigma-70 family)